MKLLHAMTVDVEGFFEGKLDVLRGRIEYERTNREIEEIKINVQRTLDIFENSGIRATFFVLGNVAEDIPEIVKEIASRGHEIGSHGYSHRHIHRLSTKETVKEISDSKKLLEDTIGNRVYGFRAPFFSITTHQKHILHALADAGYLYDSSIFPTWRFKLRGHDIYGDVHIPPYIHRCEMGIIEYPTSTLKVKRWRIPALGGGYFRIYPLVVTKLILAALQNDQHRGMVYLHPYEIGGNYPKISQLSLIERQRFCMGMKRVANRLRLLINEFSFGAIEDVLKEVGMDSPNSL